tara:strand:- start:26 stop:196 length:171 start_codon:yes stop_codon:yes gene_type:complete
MEQQEETIKVLEDALEMRECLVFIIQTLDSEFNREVQSNKNPIGLIREKVDKVLNH